MLDLKALLTKTLVALKARLLYNDFTVTSHVTGTKTAAYQTSQTLTATNSGWYPLGVVGFMETGTVSTYSVISNMRLTSRSSGNATIQYSYRIIGNSNTPSFTITFYVLWVRIR